MAHDTDQHCHCVSEHKPTPLELTAHHIWPMGMGGPDKPDNIVWVCPSTHYNIHELLRTMVKQNAHLPFSYFTDRYDVPVSRYAYKVALDGYNRWKAGTA